MTVSHAETGEVLRTTAMDAAGDVQRDAHNLRRQIRRNMATDRLEWFALRFALIAVKALSVGFKLDAKLGPAYIEATRYVARRGD